MYELYFMSYPSVVESLIHSIISFTDVNTLAISMIDKANNT